MKKKTFLTALCGLLTALSVVAMLPTLVIPILTYISPMVAGVIICFTAYASDKKWALGVYFAVSTVSLIILTDKEAALTYISFFGYYPLIKPTLDKLKKPLGVLFKMLIFNMSVILTALCCIYIFSASVEDYTGLGKFAVPLLLVMANVILFLYDLALKKYEPVFRRLSQKLLKRVK